MLQRCMAQGLEYDTAAASEAFFCLSGQRLHADKRGGTQTAVLLEELEECLAAPDDVEAQITEAETGELLRRFLQTVPAEARHIFILRYVYMLPVKEIAECNQISVSKVKVSLYRTRGELRRYLGGEPL